MQKSTEKPQDNIDLTKESSWDAASSIVSGFQHEPLFIEYLNSCNIDPHDKTSMDYANALSFYANDYCAAYADTVTNAEAVKINLVANAPYATHIKRQIAHYEKERTHRYLNDGEWNYLAGDLKPYAVWYNQQLSDHLYSHPETKLSQVNRALIEQTLDHFPHHTSGVEQSLLATTRGARKEAVTRQLLDGTEIDFVPGTAEDDLKGGDIIIDYKGKRVKVDIKSSLDPIAKLRGGYDYMEKHRVTYAISRDMRPGKKKQFNSIVLFPGFTENELADHCYLDPKIAKERSGYLATQLQRACIEAKL